VAGDGGPNQTLMQALGYDGRGVTVAVADSGCDSGEADSMHPDLAGRVTAFRYYGNLTDASDEHSHGTHVAGIIAGNGTVGETDEDGMLYGLGVAPGANIVVQRLFDGDGNYQPPPSFETLTRDATRAGAEIGSNSWGDDTQGRYDLSAREFDALVRDADALRSGDQPYILEFSAGNAGDGPRTIGSPAVAKNVIATGATENDRYNLPLEEFPIYDSGPDTMADFSSRGPCEDGRLKPDLVAPGTWIASLRSVFANDDNAWWPISDNYLYQGGTSQAGPHVSGAAAVFVQYWRATRTNATPSPALVKAALINAAADLYDEMGTEPTPNNDEGWGRLDLPALIAPTSDYEFLDQSVLLTNGGWFERRLVVGSSEEPLKITLTWTDVPGLPAVVPVLVNDLDLEVVAPSGVVYRGNQFEDGESVANATEADPLNNVEAVHLYEPVPGEYTLRVRASRVVQDARRDTPGLVDQDFALVVSARLAPPGYGIVTFDRRAYRAPDLIRLTLVDHDLAGQSAAVVQVRSTTEPTGEAITLQASGTTGLFTGSVATVTGPALPDGQLQVSHGDTLEAVYVDARPPATKVFRARADLRPPVIMAVTATNLFGQILVTWDTDEEATSLVRYGTNTPSLSITNRALDTAHEVWLTNVVPNRLYKFLVSSEDEAGNRATNDNGGAYFTFTLVQSTEVLLVDSFASFYGFIFPPPLSGYTDALNRLGVTYNVFDATGPTQPTLAQLQAHRCVIWRVSDLAAPSATLADRVRTYVNGGGSLLIASMEALSRFEEAGLSSFNRDVLQVNSFLFDRTVNSVSGFPGDPVGAGISVGLDYTPYEEILLLAGTDDPSDYITSYSALATPILQTPSDSGGQAVVGLRAPKPGQDMPGRVVFLSFPLDTVPLDATPGNDRAGLLRNILGFLMPVAGNSTLTLDSDVYSVPARAVVEVEDLNLAGQGQTSVTFTSPRQAGGVAVTLRETSRRGLFRGALSLLATNTGAPEVLLVQSGDTFQAGYFDARAGQTLTVTATVETNPPAIFTVSADPGYLEALVSWETSEPADALVQYAQTPSDFPNNFAAYDPAFDTSHEVLLRGLLPNRTYYFRVVSRDRAGNAATDDNLGRFHTFTTLQPKVPPWFDDMNTESPDWSIYTIDESETEWTRGEPGGGETAHSPPACWGSNLGGGPLTQAECYLISPGLLLSGGNRATLRFWHNYDFTPKSEWDLIELGAVEILTDLTAEPVPIAQFLDWSDGWEAVEVDLTPYMGNVVYILWYYGLLSFEFEDIPRLGWLVDDVSVTVDYVAPGTVVVTNNLSQAYFALAGPVGTLGAGTWTRLTNAPPGRYVVTFGDVPHYLTPPAQTNTLESGQVLTFRGDYTFPDANRNGISDLWEAAYFGNFTNYLTGLDSDSDGMNDFAEVVAGTDPNRAASKLELARPAVTGANLLRLQWQGVAGRNYRVQSSSDVAHWSPASGWLTATADQSMSVDLPRPPANTPAFFRLECSATLDALPANLDCDQDGMSDYAEFIAGTDPTHDGSRLALAAPVLLPNNLLRLEWEAAEGRAYRVQASANAASWTPVTDWLRADAPQAMAVTLSRAVVAPACLFRLEVRP
jgi:hypothetical protein